MSNFGLLELIAQALLPLLTSGTEQIEVTRLVREVWAHWMRLSDAASRQASLHCLASASFAEQRQAIEEIIRQQLPGKPDAKSSALSRYLLAIPSILRRLGSLGINHAEEMLRRLPPRIPLFAEGDHPAGAGDRELMQLARIGLKAEVWITRNPRLPDRPSMLTVYFTGQEEAARVLAWHTSHPNLPGVIPLEDSAIGASPPSLTFSSITFPPLNDRLELFRAAMRAVSVLHQRRPPVTVGRIFPGDIFLRQGQIEVLVIDPHLQDDPRQDMPYLGRIGAFLLPGTEGDLADALEACQNNDPLERPAHAGLLLEKMPPSPAQPPAEPVSTSAAAPPTESTPARARVRRGSEVWQILDTLQKPGPELAKVITNAIGMRFVLIPAGKFVMGSPSDEAGRRDNEGPQHEVIITRPFYLGIHPVTQAQYLKVMGTNPARFQGAAGGGPDHPVESVSWDDAQNLARWLSEMLSESQARRSYRLPTEAEWEYACRAGSTTPFSFGNTLSGERASIDGNHPYGDAPRTPSVPRTARVGSFPANHFGLYDMHGNVWEWCADWYDAAYYPRAPRQDPPGPEVGLYRVLRGGSWRNQAATCRSAYRNALAPNQRQPFIGFRLVLDWSPE
ncbi:MAG: formylglycine-generating enzyme family protein [Gemmataceae bacterium]